MFRISAVALVALGLASVPAFAEDDVKPTEAEAKSIAAALEALGCKGYDEMEKETKKDGSYHYEIDDTVCADGQQDIKLDKDFKVISRSKD